MGKVTRALALAALAASVACTVHQTEVPPLGGPSGLALSLEVTATPDSISQDGASQSSVMVFARNASARPISGLAIRLDITVGGQAVDFGTLSARTIVTGTDGKARAVFTAPPPPPTSTSNSFVEVDIWATAMGNNADTAQSNYAAVRLTPPGVILPPAGTPTATFVFTPTPVTAGIPVLFDATASRPGSGASQIASYAWTFGDGSTGTGATVNHAFNTAGTYTVTLTVTNDRGMSASTTQQVAATLTAAPAAAFEFSPTTPAVNGPVFFNAASSRAAPGRNIVKYNWDFGDGSPNGSGSSTSHVYTAANTYKVVLTVTDDLGQTGTLAKDVPIK